jgi:HlyD family secretion protein
MSATVDILTKTESNVLTVPIMAVTTRVIAGKEKKEEKNISDSEGEAQSIDNANEGGEVEEVVFVYSEGKVRKVRVKTGIQDNDFIRIVSGLKGGEEVISAPYSAISKILKDSMEVVVVEAAQLYTKKE